MVVELHQKEGEIPLLEETVSSAWEVQLTKLRALHTSGLEAQRSIASILAGVEETIASASPTSGTNSTTSDPIAYFGCLMSLFQHKTDPSHAEMLASAAYILAAVFPHLKVAVLRSKFDNIVDILLLALQTSLTDHAPAVRSILTCFEVLLVNQETGKWNTASSASRESLMRLLQVVQMLCLDPRPKVRKRAQEAIYALTARPKPPAQYHPATPIVLDYCNKMLDECLKEGGGGNASSDEWNTQMLHILGFLKFIIPSLVLQSSNPKVCKSLNNLCAVLIRIPVKSSGTGHVLMTQAIFELLKIFFGGDHRSDANTSAKQQLVDIQKDEFLMHHLDVNLVDMVVRALITIQPYHNDATLLPVWLELLELGLSRLGALVASAIINEEGITSHTRQYGVQTLPKLVSSIFLEQFAIIFAQNAPKPQVLASAVILFSGIFRFAVSLDMIHECQIIDNVISGNSSLGSMISLVNSALTQIRYKDSWGSIIQISGALLERIGQTSAELCCPTITHLMAFRDDSNYVENFPFKEDLEMALQRAIQAMGMGAFLTMIPLNMEQEIADQPRRPYLLSTLSNALKMALCSGHWYPDPKASFSRHSLLYFSSVMLPLAKRMFTKAGDAIRASKKRQLEAKLYETLGYQIWTLMPDVCAGVPFDTAIGFDKFAPYLGQTLQLGVGEMYPDLPSNPDFRPLVCDALGKLIYGVRQLNKTISESSGIAPSTVKAAADGLSILQSYSTKFMATLCNNFTAIRSSPEDGNVEARSNALQTQYERENSHYAIVIGELLHVANKSAVNNYFYSLVKTYLRIQAVPGFGIAERMQLYSILDLALLLLPFLATDASGSDMSPQLFFYNMLLGQLRDTDPTLQKKTYKALASLLADVPEQTADRVLPHHQQMDIIALAEAIVEDAVVEGVSAGAKKSRMHLFQKIVQLLHEQNDILIFIPVALSEVILATKESSEKARHAAYECLVAMGRKMDTPQTVDAADALDMSHVQRALSAEASEEDTQAMVEKSEAMPVPQVNFREFVMMVVAGLAGSTTHMQSAAIASLGRIIFDFRASIDAPLMQDILSTVLCFMVSKNREVIKASLGFIKVAIVAVPKEMLAVHLESIVTNSLTHSRDNKSHFKAKVRHIFERLVRKYSVEEIDVHVPEGDKKLLVNIRKRRERLKKQKAQERKVKAAGGNEEEHVSASSKKESTSTEFEEALYGSESELDDSEDEEDTRMEEDFMPSSFEPSAGKKKGGQKTAALTRLREGEGEVIDFLGDHVVSQITSGPKRKAKHGSSSFESVNGRLLINESDAEDEDGMGRSRDDKAGSGDEEDVMKTDHYKNALTSETAFTRTRDGRIKFIKRKRGEEDVEGGGESRQTGVRWNGGKNSSTANQQSLIKDSMLGRQYKSKRAKGDVKRPGMADPHAYIPLNAKLLSGKGVQNIFRPNDHQSGKNANGGRQGKKAPVSNVFKGNKKHK